MTGYNRPILTREPSEHVGVLVTPEMAIAWLRDNPQRAPQPEKILRYAEQMREGTFPTARSRYPDGTVRPKPIRFSRFGRLQDGQHRLFAIALFNLPYVLDILTGQEG
jgi:hypothetical protein